MNNHSKVNENIPYYPLVPLSTPWFLERTLQSRLASLNRIAADYQSLDSQLERVVSYIARAHFAKELSILMDLAQTYEELYSGYYRESGRSTFNVTGVNVSLYAAFEKGRVVEQVDAIRLKDLYRKLAALTHPDKDNGNPELFRLAKYLYSAKDVEGLYLLWVSILRPEDFDVVSLLHCVDFVDRRIGVLHTRLVRLQAMRSFKVVQFWTSGNHERAKELVRELMFDRAKQLASDIYGLEVKTGKGQPRE